MSQPAGGFKPVTSDAATPWMGWMKARLGWNETNNDKQLSDYWKYTDYHPGTVVGPANAWCAMAVCAALEESGYQSTRDASAISYADYGTESILKPGCIVVIEHTNGHHHVTFCESVIDEHHVNCLGGNQEDSIKVSRYEFGMGGDKIIATRWPIPALKAVTKGQPIAALPWEKGHAERLYWSKACYTFVLEQLQYLDQAQDLDVFTSKYGSLAVEQRATLWACIFACIAYFECSWDPTQSSVDVGTEGDQNTYSVGLLQLSVIDQESYKIKLGYNFEDLKDPVKNLNLGIKIMSLQIQHFKKIIIRPGEPGLYWSSLHPGGDEDHTQEIIAMTKAALNFL